MKQAKPAPRDPADYGYPTSDLAALEARAAEVSRRLTERYGELPFSDKDPLSQLVDILLFHRTRDEQTAAAYANLLRVFGSRQAVAMMPSRIVCNGQHQAEKWIKRGKTVESKKRTYSRTVGKELQNRSTATQDVVRSTISS